MAVKASWSGDGDPAATARRRWMILVHGGAGRSESDDLRSAGCRRAVEAAAQILLSGAPAVDAVQLAVRVLEDDPLFNAGTGACLTEDGLIELDAGIMEGTSLAAGAVCALPPFRHPIDVARAAMNDGRHVLYAAEGAAAFARSAGFEPSTVEAMTTDRARRKWEELRRAARASAMPSNGTVGAVARDGRGALAAATSTGGVLGKRSGRVGDSPILGAGTFADDEAGAASATGQGEGILRTCLAKTAVDEMRRGLDPESAARRVVQYLSDRAGASGGIILVDARGRLGWAYSTPAMAWAAVWQGAAESIGGA